MGLNLTPVRGKVNNIKRNLFYGTGQLLNFYDINELILELDKDWFMHVGATSNMAIGAEYFELKIAATGTIINFEDIIPRTSVVAIGGEKYKVIQFERPRGLTKQWTLRLESTGMHI